MFHVEHIEAIRAKKKLIFFIFPLAFIESICYNIGSLKIKKGYINMKQQIKKRKVKIDVKARYGHGCHEIKTISLYQESFCYLTMSKYMYKKLTDSLCCSGGDYLIQVNRNSSYVVCVRDSSGTIVNVF